MTIEQLKSSGISWRHGAWEYGGRGGQPMWPGGAPGCRDACNKDPGCYHWVFDCKDWGCKLYSNGGYEEDGSKQFGRDYCFLGDID
eukprot:CAMPEP_0198546164 /NCGR_PEP_ID=MMETSP1462-20131121/66484_1 /TAXON_ID=1333877 /ORGANISM="Brandtodinium nutriculum, Strain RCC3387" /LENGTH=85 /DNA_ID=CAMNT_0044276597 /DNA_START=27 /DNA_END=281 /DNA_ORIENTATION=+